MSQPYAAVRQKLTLAVLVFLVLVPKRYWNGNLLNQLSSYNELYCHSSYKKGNNMDKEHVKGAVEKTKGAIKDQAGKLTDDKKMQAEGKMDKAKGTAHKIAGDVKDAARDATEK
jgi:uncharacterized protein YjbJ (UPF0337 family)